MEQTNLHVPKGYKYGYRNYIIIMEAVSQTPNVTQTVEPTEDTSNKLNVLDVNIENENVALNVLVTFINLAQKRGAFNLNESAKIWECVEKFQHK
jgi:hypothetical protein